MNHECYGCGRSYSHSDGQLVRRSGNYICVRCYSKSANGLSNTARIQRQIRLAGSSPVKEAKGLPIAIDVKKALKPKPEMSEVPRIDRIETVGEPILFEDEDISF